MRSVLHEVLPSLQPDHGKLIPFRVYSMQLTPYSDSVSLRLHLQRLNLATHRNSAAHNAKGTLSGFTIAL
jgi:hypothetical protein